LDVSLRTEALASHLDKGGSIDEHGVVDKGLAGFVAFAAAVVTKAFDEVLDSDFVADKVDAYEAGNVAHVDPEDLCADGRVFTIVERCELRLACGGAHRDRASAAEEGFIGEFFGDDGH